MLLLNWFLALIATINISEIIVYEAIFEPLRLRLGIVRADSGELLAVDDRWLSRLFSCFRCTSVWVGGGMGILALLFPPLLLPLALPYLAYKTWGLINRLTT